MNCAHFRGPADSLHQKCFACGDENPAGLRLIFQRMENGRVVSDYNIQPQYQGYPGIAQGGIVATLLDSAMANCLFTMNVQAMTARLNVKFREPVELSEKVHLEAELISSRGRTYELRSALSQNGVIKASATARFVRINKKT